MQFHPEVRRILRSATLLALADHSDSVAIVHLLDGAPHGQLPEPMITRDIPFHPEALAVLSLAAEQAKYDDSAVLRKGYLDLALLIQTAKLPVWSDSRSRGFYRFLLVTARQAAAIRHTDSRSLQKLAEIEFPPAEIDLTGPERARFQKRAERAQGLAALPVLTLLGHVLSRNPIGQILSHHGLDESILTQILQGAVAAGVESAPKPLDFTPCLGPGWERLSLESKNTLALAWVLRDHDELSGRDLLRALIANSNQLEESNIHSLLHSLRPEAGFADQLVNHAARSKHLPPILSAEIYRALGIAMGEAGPDRPVSNLDLLIGLAECSQELLGIPPAEIRQRHAQSSTPLRPDDGPDQPQDPSRKWAK